MVALWLGSAGRGSLCRAALFESAAAGGQAVSIHALAPRTRALFPSRGRDRFRPAAMVSDPALGRAEAPITSLRLKGGAAFLARQAPPAGRSLPGELLNTPRPCSRVPLP